MSEEERHDRIWMATQLQARFKPEHPTAPGLLTIPSGRLPCVRLCLRSLNWALPGMAEHLYLVWDTSQNAIPVAIARRADRLARDPSIFA